MQHAIGRPRRKALELLVQFARTKQRQHHQLFEIGAGAFDAGLVAHSGVAAVAADHIVGLQDLAARSALVDADDAHAVAVLRDGLRHPAEARLDIGQLRYSFAQHIFTLILRQPFVVPEIIGVDDLAQRRRVPVFVVEVMIGNDAAHRIRLRQHARGLQLFGDAPEIKMLGGALRQVLAFGDALRVELALDHTAGNAALAELDCKCNANGATADDGDLIVLLHFTFLA